MINKRVVIIQMLHLIRNRIEDYLCHAFDTVASYYNETDADELMPYAYTPEVLMRFFPEIEKIAKKYGGKTENSAWWMYRSRNRILTLEELLTHYPPVESDLYKMSNYDESFYTYFEEIKEANPYYTEEQIVLSAIIKHSYDK